MYLLTRLLHKWYLALLYIAAVAAMILAAVVMALALKGWIDSVDHTRYINIYPANGDTETARAFANALDDDEVAYGYKVLAMMQYTEQTNSSIFATPRRTLWFSDGRSVVFGLSSSVSAITGGSPSAGRDLNGWDLSERSKVVYLCHDMADKEKGADGTATETIAGEEFQVIGMGAGNAGSTEAYVPLTAFFDAGLKAEYIALLYPSNVGKSAERHVKEICREIFAAENYTIVSGVRDIDVNRAYELVIVVLCAAFLLVIGMGLFNLISLAAFLRKELDPALYAYRLVGGRLTSVVTGCAAGAAALTVVGALLGAFCSELAGLKLKDSAVLFSGVFAPAVIGMVCTFFILTKNLKNTVLLHVGEGGG